MMCGFPSKPTLSSLAKSSSKISESLINGRISLARFLKSRPYPERECGAVSNGAWQDIYIGALSLVNSEVSSSKWLSLQRISTSSLKGAIQRAIIW